MHAEHTPITEWKVLVHPGPDETVRGLLRFVEGKPKLTLESGEVIDSETEDMTYSVDHEIVVGEKGESVFSELKDRVRIVLKPHVVRNLPYAPYLASIEEDMYPPSTNGWYGRYMMAPADSLFSYEKLPFIYLIQPITEQNKFWLTILDRKSGILFESHPIRLYEKPILHMLSDLEYRKQRVKAVWDIQRLKKKALQILDGPPPSWEQLTHLAQGVLIQDLKVKDNMGQSLDPLVPNSIPDEQREQIKAFLALTLSITRIPNEDPVEYLEQYYGTRLLRYLLSIHLRILAQGIKLPDYVALLFAAEKGELEEKRIYEGPRQGVIRGLESTLLKPPYYKHYWEEIRSHIDLLNNSKTLKSDLPITKSQAKKTRKSWLTRIELMMAGTKINIQVRYNSIGLSQLVYFGSAHTWTHQHLAWFAKTRDISNMKFPMTRFFQVMVMPPSTSEQIKRAMVKISEIEWSFRKVNYHLYNADSREWSINISKLISSIDEKYSVRKLNREFKLKKSSSIHKITFEEAQAIDIAKSGLYLDTINTNVTENNVGFTVGELFELLDQLQSKRVLDISYETTAALDEKNTTYLTVAEGNSEKLCAIARAYLFNTPSSFVFLEKGARRIYILSRIPKVSAYDLIRNLPQEDERTELMIRCSEIFGYRAYEHNLLQRLLRKDGSWITNAYELLSQAR